MNPESQPDISVVIVSFNTRAVLQECLETLYRNSAPLLCQVLVVDNASKDGSADMVAQRFPQVELIRSQINLGFVAGNNLAFPHARGRYVVLLNSDAFLYPEALTRSVAHMDAHPEVGLGGGMLVSRDGQLQPSARIFPSLLNDFLTISGLAAARPKSRFFGRFDRTWADPAVAAPVDWVPGAFVIVRRPLLEQVGYFDENMYIYYEEVDLCRRIKAAGHAVWYWPDVQVIHLGGESSKTVKRLSMASSGSQLTLWRMRSELLFYRKHHGWAGAWLAMHLERGWHLLRGWRNQLGPSPVAQAKAEESRAIRMLFKQAWSETRGGQVSPLRPW